MGIMAARLGKESFPQSLNDYHDWRGRWRQRRRYVRDVSALAGSCPASPRHGCRTPPRISRDRCRCTPHGRRPRGPRRSGPAAPNIPPARRCRRERCLPGHAGHLRSFFRTLVRSRGFCSITMLMARCAREMALRAGPLGVGEIGRVRRNHAPERTKPYPIWHHQTCSHVGPDTAPTRAPV